MPFLNLHYYTSSIIEESDHDIHIHLALKDPVKPTCQHCQNKELQSFGKRSLHYMDLPMRGKRVGLEVEAKRYRCKKCSKITQQSLPDMSEDYRMTSRLAEYIRHQSILRPFTHLAEEIGVSEGTVRKLFNDYVDELERQHRFETPKVMGIDEIHLAKRPRCVITNIEERTIIEMLKDRNKPTVRKYLKDIEKPHVILNVAMDMWRPYRDTVKEILPDAVVVIDKFHVVRMANNALEKCRKEIRASLPANQRRDLRNDRFIMLKRESELKPREQFLLSHWKLNYPRLGKVYDLKESFYGIYEAADAKEAYNRYNEWENGLEDDVRHYFADLHRAVNNWHREIFSYFDHPITNAYTESMNSVIRHIDRMGRSYGFESIRAKILYASNLHHLKKKPKFTKRRTRSFSGFGMVMDKHVQSGTTYDTKNYGVSLDKLARMLESGNMDFEV